MKLLVVPYKISFRINVRPPGGRKLVRPKFGNVRNLVMYEI